MLSSSPCGLRKGSWTQEEDMLLKKCIEKHGEGKWHQVPLQAGLNRCRKSCRLRWLNYLRPNIKRGAFESDEVDLIIRLHKLLGNRWSLIAGRIPGRTANDVKNLWNSHIQKKLTTGRQQEEVIKGKGSNGELLPEKPKSILIKPRPLNFSKHAPPRSSSRESNNVTTIAPIKIQENLKESEPSLKKPLINLDDDDDDTKWWDDLFGSIHEIGIGGTSSFSGIDKKNISTETSPGLMQENLNSSEQEKPSGWGDIPIFADFWESLNSDQMH